MADVLFEHVHKTFPGGVVAVEDLTLAVGDGEFVVLVGPSGCGKTTTLRLVAGLERLTSGRIAIGGRTVSGLHPRDRDVAMVFQDYALYPHMTAGRNLSFGLRMRKVPRPEIERRVAATARLLGIGDLLDRKPRELSGGQQQRVALGRAIVREPKCFLFDEPLSNLDATLRLRMRVELKSLHMRLKTTSIYVTHDQEEAMTLAHRLVVMLRGVVQQIGTPMEVYRRPANRFVAAFLGSPPMSFLEGRVERVNGVLALAGDGGLDVPLPAPLVAAAARRVDRPIVLGVRPELWRIAHGDGAGADNVVLTARVQVVEPLGERMDVVVEAAGSQSITARVQIREDLAPGDEIRLVAPAGKLHLFEPGEAGRALPAG